MNIEIITTPNDRLKESGFGSLEACTNVLAAIKKTNNNAKLIVCESLKDLEEVVKRKPDLVILAVKYIVLENKENVWLSKYFKEHNITFSGSSREILKFDSDKVLAKAYLKEKGIKTANYFTAVPNQYQADEYLPIKYPLFLKPLDAANGNGIDALSFVNNFGEFERKVSSLYKKFGLPVLVEEYIDGQEFTVAIIETLEGKLLVSALEIIPPILENGVRILGEKTKKENSETLRKPSDSFLLESVKSLAVDAFVSLGVRDFGRIDIKTNKQGESFFIEANLVPGMTEGSSYFPKACEITNGLSYDEVIGLIVEKTIVRAPLNIALTKPLYLALEEEIVKRTIGVRR